MQNVRRARGDQSVGRGEERLNPQCADCKWPERAARQEAEAVEFVVLLGDTAEELAAAVAALR